MKLRVAITKLYFCDFFFLFLHVHAILVTFWLQYFGYIYIYIIQNEITKRRCSFVEADQLQDECSLHTLNIYKIIYYII